MSECEYDGNDPSATDVERARVRNQDQRWLSARRLFDAYNRTPPNPNKTWDGKDVPPFASCGEQVTAKWGGAADEAHRLGLEFGRRIYDAAMSGLARAVNAACGDQPTPQWHAVVATLRAIVQNGMSEANNLLKEGYMQNDNAALPGSGQAPSKAPSIGSIVHYTNLGDRDGKYPPEVQAALITGIGNPDAPSGTVSLHVFYKTGQFDLSAVEFTAEPAGTEGARGKWTWPVCSPSGVEPNVAGGV